MKYKVDDVVAVPPPIDGDIHNHEFWGRIISISIGGDMLSIIDSNDDVFDIETERVRKYAGTKYSIAYGNPFDGMGFEGVFDCEKDAVAYAERYFEGKNVGDWWIITIDPVEDGWVAP